MDYVCTPVRVARIVRRCSAPEVALVSIAAYEDHRPIIVDVCDIEVGEIAVSHPNESTNLPYNRNALRDPKLRENSECEVWKFDDSKYSGETNDVMLERSIIKIYECQTDDEQSTQDTQHRNNIGFNSCDANILSSFAVQIATNTGWRTEGERLSHKQRALARRKMLKYSGQLAKIANGKE